MKNVKLLKKLLIEVNSMEFLEKMFFDVLLMDRNDAEYEDFVSKEILEMYEENGNDVPDWVNVYFNTPDKEKAKVEAIEDYIATFLALNEEET